MNIVYAALLGFAIDLLLGDPAWMPHPVVYMGKCISFLEKVLKRSFPKTHTGELIAGGVMAVLLPTGTFALSMFIIWAAGMIFPALGVAAQVIWSWQVLAMSDLKKESMNVLKKLTGDTLVSAREAVSRIVGRDTANLSAEGVTKAAIETVAENFSDGEIAPLVCLLIGGAPLGLAYKAVNTMDSMVGYKNERFLYFGRCAAKLDDVVNFIPARISAILLILASGLCGADMKNAWKIWRRDRYKHASPNSAQTESVMAGALNVQLAGPAYYFGEYYDKPTIGDPIRPVEADDIRRANKIMYCAGFIGLAVFVLFRVLVVRLTG